MHPEVKRRLDQMPPRCKETYKRAVKGSSRAAAIKAMCQECLGWELSKGDCTAPGCPLYAFRPGVRRGLTVAQIAGVEEQT